MNNEMLKKLIMEGESEYCDFKQEHHENKASLVHDILSLANSQAKSNRFLIFGV
jgi:predicted HTH transcriptional regulator